MELEHEVGKPAIKNTVENLSEHLVDYAETYLKLGIVNATQKAHETATAIVATLLLALLYSFAILFLGFGVANWLNYVWHTDEGGYFAVGGFFVIVIVTFVLLRRNTIVPFLRDYLIRKSHE